MTMIEIGTAQTPEDLESIRGLFRQYQHGLGVDLCFQDFEAELAGLPGKYAAPTGALLIARDGDVACGCVAVRPMEGTICEMKRLFVRPDRRGRGLGRRLAEAILIQARSLGYTTMRLDTLERLTEAMCLYESMGFRRISAYYDNPLIGVVYWELELQESRKL
jgi:putative acetyltransferase